MSESNVIDLVAEWKKRGRHVRAPDVLAPDPLAPTSTTSTRFREERGVIVQTFDQDALPDERVVYDEAYAKRVGQYLLDYARRISNERYRREKISAVRCAAWGNCWKPAEEGGDLCTRHRREAAREARRNETLAKGPSK